MTTPGSGIVAGIRRALGQSPGAPPCNPDLRTLRDIVAWLDQAAESIDDALDDLDGLEVEPDVLKRQIDRDLGDVEATITSIADALWTLRLESGPE